MTRLVLFVVIYLLALPAIAQITQSRKSNEKLLIEGEIIRDSRYYENIFKQKNLRLHNNIVKHDEPVTHDTYNMPIKIPADSQSMPIWKPDSTINYSILLKKYE